MLSPGHWRKRGRCFSIESKRSKNICYGVHFMNNIHLNKTVEIPRNQLLYNVEFQVLRLKIVNKNIGKGIEGIASTELIRT
jgi:hypothetical protein